MEYRPWVHMVKSKVQSGWRVDIAGVLMEFVWECLLLWGSCDREGKVDQQGWWWGELFQYGNGDGY